MDSSSADSKDSSRFQLGFGALPQYGFGPDLTFDSLVENNPYLFRVYTPKPLSPFFDSSEPFFIGQRFKNNYRYTVQDFQASSSSLSPDQSAIPNSYADVANHMDWSKKSSSPFVTTSFSFAWAIWEATRRYKSNPKQAIEIAVIDAKAVAGRAVTALELLRKGTPKERHQDHWKWYRFATEAQDVLIYGYVPGTAVLSSIPILSLVPKLPSYFLNPNPNEEDKNFFSNLTWDVTQQRSGYQQFCQQMSEQFLRSSAEVRLRDTTTSSVRLAMTFLRPWFQKYALKDFQGAVDNVAEFAYIVARWPGQWWVREHTEIWDLIQSMVHVIGEEVRDAQRIHALNEVTRLQGVVSELQLLTDEFMSVHSRSGSDDSSDEADPPESSSAPAPVSASASLAPPEDPKALPGHVASTVETASCVITSFLFGAFAALFVINSQRRDLALHFT